MHRPIHRPSKRRVDKWHLSPYEIAAWYATVTLIRERKLRPTKPFSLPKPRVVVYELETV